MPNPVKFTRTAYKSGGSIAITIPMEICEAFNITDQTRLNLHTIGDMIVVEKKED